MAYEAKTPEAYWGKVVGNGQCVAFVEQASGAPPTAEWKKGCRVRHYLTLPTGTAIATFSAEGTYSNIVGASHAAIYVSQDALGINVWDQWYGQPVHQRLIPFRGVTPGVEPVNNGDDFYVID